MKKIISIILMITMLLSLCMTLSFAHDGEYNTCDEIQANVEENADNYFLPAAYDISPFSNLLNFVYGISDFHLMDMSCEEFYDKYVVYDEKNKIAVPPIYTLFEPIETDEYDVYYNNFITLRQLYYNKDNNRNNISMSPDMWRVLHDDVPLEVAIDAYIAPWTLYNDSELYTWNDLMEMDEEQLNALDFDTYEFSRFINDVKNVLVTRGWWKDEYQEKHDILYSHKDDYHKIQNYNEVIQIQGEKVYLSRLYYEYSCGKTPSVGNIISANIYAPEFVEGINTLDSSVKEKYREMLDDINKEYNSNIRNQNHENSEKFYDLIYGTEAGPNVVYACEFALSELVKFVDGNYEVDGDMEFITLIDKYNISDDEIKQAVAEFNYVYSGDQTLGSEIVDKLCNSTKKELVDYFAYDTSVVFSYGDEIVVVPWYIISEEDLSSSEYSEEVSRIDEYKRVIDKMEDLYKKAPSSNKEQIRDNINYLRSYANIPETGENTALYIAIAGAAVVAMTALLVRKKREIV